MLEIVILLCVVLDDPNYEHRRQYEERKHEYEAQLRREAEDL
jgi:hypothetical protein